VVRIACDDVAGIIRQALPDPVACGGRGRWYHGEECGRGEEDDGGGGSGGQGPAAAHPDVAAAERYIQRERRRRQRV